jgi:hypothetical protein
MEEGSPMRLAPIAALAVTLCLAPSAGLAAQRRNNPMVCAQIANQLVHYDSLKARAASEGNAVWVARFKGKIAELEQEFELSCPEQAAQEKTLQQLAEILKTAGRAALSFFSMGAY